MGFGGGFTAYASTHDARKKLRYVGVAAAFMPLGQGLIQVLGPCLDNYTAASLLAATIVTVPNFFANKHFVWRRTTSENIRKNMLVFWVVVLLGVSLATWFTHLVDQVTVDRTTLVRGTAIFIVQLCGFGIAWIGRFFVLDRWLFKDTHHEQPLTSSRAIPTRELQLSRTP
ncbi:hypothetical protein [Mycobacterium asiaticum]|uniref:GtrA/DPMS transmembrane domain-containing protein n=1 Tax=Mycobacterium asiaticum TaxID=1790 RepID=A0A1A3CUV4_MYCAS|nr:hypothetical protein [Mycobacterium asiaticum]OBI89846.1 hypothetical protein A9X01_13500 [Mycobacterium asiaticum]